MKTEESKKCPCCKEVKLFHDFSKDNTKKNGYRSHCKSCRKEAQKKYQGDNSKNRVEYFRKYYFEKPEGVVLNNIKQRAKIKNVPFDITIEDIPWVTHCPVFGWELKRGKGSGPRRQSPSVDRVIPELGYVKGNIQVMSSKANSMKQDATPEELLMFADWILKTYQK